MDFFGWLDELLGGGSTGGSTGGQNLGGISGAWSFGLSHYFAQAPGPLAPVLTTYFTSGINFDDPSELAEAMAMLDQASTLPTAVDDATSDSRRTRGTLQQVVAYGEGAVDAPVGHANRTVGQLDDAAGAAETYRGPGRRFGDADAGNGPSGGRRLETLDRWGLPSASDTDTAVKRRLLGTPTEQPWSADSADVAHRTRPENARPARPETDAGPVVPVSSAIYYGRDSSGNPVYVLGTAPLPVNRPYGPPRPPEAVAEVQIRGTRPPQQGNDAILEVHVRGTRPARPPQTPSPRPENTPDTEDDRDFWNRGGAGLLLGVTTATIGTVIILSNPLGWVVGITGALMLASGTAASLGSGVQLGASYAGQTTAGQDAAMNRATAAVLAASSPGGIAGGVAGTVYSGDAGGFERGAFVGGLAEGAVSLGAGLGRMGAREIRFGRPTNMSWNRTVAGEISARARNQQVYGLGDVAARSRPNRMFPGSVERIELSHFLPQSPTKNPASLPARLRHAIGASRYERMVNRPFNVTPMWGAEHALVDPARYQFMKAEFKLLNPQLAGPARWSRFTPPWLVRSAYGGVRGGLTLGEGLLTGDTGDQGETDPEAEAEELPMPPD